MSVLEAGLVLKMTYNTETKDGTEHGSRERETRLQTEVDIGSVDKRAEQDTNNNGTRRQRVRLINDTLQRGETGEEIGDGLVHVGRLRLEIFIDGLCPLLVGVSGSCSTASSWEVVGDGISRLLVVADGGEFGVPSRDNRVGVHDEGGCFTHRARLLIDVRRNKGQQGDARRGNQSLGVAPKIIEGMRRYLFSCTGRVEKGRLAISDGHANTPGGTNAVIIMPISVPLGPGSCISPSTYSCPTRSMPRPFTTLAPHSQGRHVVPGICVCSMSSGHAQRGGCKCYDTGDGSGTLGSAFQRVLSVSRGIPE